MAPKGKPYNEKAQGGSSPLNGKPYKDAVTELFSCTALTLRDVDQKAIQLLDALQKVGKANAGCEHLKVSLEGIAREKVQNWKAYSYKLLRDFDTDVYTKMKAKSEGNRRQSGKKGDDAALNPNPVEFQPGVWWSGDHQKGALQPSQPAGYPMNMMMMGMNPGMMPQMAQYAPYGASPPPPPQKAAQVPKAAAAKAPAPDKPADAKVTTEAKEGEKKEETAATPEAAR
jgi:hypothetical protein